MPEASLPTTDGGTGQYGYPTTPSGAGTTASPNQQVTNYVWAQTVLADAGLPTTPNNVSNIAAWMTHENGASDWWNRNNPLNASLGTSASDGTASYPSLTVAAQYTAQMIQQQNMASIYNALAANASPGDFSTAVVQSPWAISHYGVAPYSPAQYLIPGRLATFMADARAPVVTDTGATLAPGTASGSSGGGSSSSDSSDRPAGTCSPSGGIDILGAHIGTGCQLKALTGGLLVGVGMGIMLAGVFLVLGKSSTFRSAAGAVGGAVVGGPEGAAVGATVARSTAPATPPSTVAPPATPPSTVAPPVTAPASDTTDDDTTDYDLGFSAALESMMASPSATARNKRQANRQAESLFDQLGISSSLGDVFDDAPF